MKYKNPFYIVRPLSITDAVLTSSNVPEPATVTDPDPAAWNAATAYAEGDRVSRLARHEIYQRVIAGTSATAPEADDANWVFVGPTNRHRMFDLSNESQTANGEQIVIVLTPGVAANTLVILNAEANTVRVQVAGTSYDRTQRLRTRAARSAWQCITEPFVYRRDVVFDNLPPLRSNVITVTLSKAGGTARCGTCVVGMSKVIGGTKWGAAVGIISNGTKKRDAFGNTQVVPRTSSKRINLPVLVDTARIDEIRRQLAEYEFTPLVYVGAGNLHASLVASGYYRDFELVFSGPLQSAATISIEGLLG